MASNWPVGTLKLWTNMERVAKSVMEEMRVSIRQTAAEEIKAILNWTGTAAFSWLLHRWPGPGDWNTAFVQI